MDGGEILLQCGPHNLGRNDKKKNNTALQAVLSLELEEVIKQGRLTKGQGWHPAAEKKQSPAPAPARPAVWEERASRAAASQSRFLIQCLIIAI